MSPLTIEPPTERAETPKKKTHISALSKEICVSPQKENESVVIAPIRRF